jgi:hypothetical protein
MVNLKNITELPLAESANNLKFIVNDNGSAKQIAANNIGAGAANLKPLILDATLSDYYGGNSEAGDEALEAIKAGRQILVRVPNASGDNYVATYSPIYMYQVPLDGMYLYLFYLKDEKQDLSALLGQPAGTVVMPTYGEFTMLLSKKYDSNPIE